MGSIIATTLVIAIVMVVSIAWLDRTTCHARWSEYEPVWGLASGCRIKIDGRYTPTDNIKEIGIHD